MSAILVTGANGLVGAEVMKLLESRPVVALTRNPPLRLSPNVIWVEHDLTRSSVPEIGARVDTVLHLAQSRFYREFPTKADDIFEVNVASTLRLLEWARLRRVKRFVYASSGGVYGHGDGPFDERSPPATDQELGFYLATKRCGELLVQSYRPHMTVIILRPFFIYGPRQSPHMLIQRLVASVAAGRPVTLQGAQGLRINPLHVEDAARAFARALDLEESSTVNVAGSEVLTLREIATTIGKVVGREPIFEEVDAPPRHLVGDTKKMHQILCVPVVPFASGVLSLRDGSGARGTSGTTTRS